MDSLFSVDDSATWCSPLHPDQSELWACQNWHVTFLTIWGPGTKLFLVSFQPAEIMLNPTSTKKTLSCRGILSSNNEVKIKPNVYGQKCVCVQNIYLSCPEEWSIHDTRKPSISNGNVWVPQGPHSGTEWSPLLGGGYDKQLLESYLIIFGLVSKSYVVLSDFFSFF